MGRTLISRKEKFATVAGLFDLVRGKREVSSLEGAPKTLSKEDSQDGRGG